MIATSLTAFIESKLQLLEALDGAPVAAWPGLLRAFAATVSEMVDGHDDVLAVLAIDMGETLYRLAVRRGVHPQTVMALDGLRGDAGRSLVTTALALAAAVESGSALSSPQVVATQAYIEQCYWQPHLTVAELARVAGASPAHLEALFRRELRVPIHEYLVRARMTKAIELLRQGEKIEAIASLVGYRSRRAFNASFKKRFGAPPQTFLRRERAGAHVLNTAADSQP